MKKSKGFTLIELLVVVAILGLLATIVAVSLTSARARARDARRVSDIRQMELAFELYYAAHQQYPVSSATALGALLTEGFLNMSLLPKDPRTGTFYCYASGKRTVGAGTYETQYYHIGTALENKDSDMLCQDRDFDSSAVSAITTWELGAGMGGDCIAVGTTGFNGGGTGGACGENSAVPYVYDRGVLP